MHNMSSLFIKPKDNTEEDNLRYYKIINCQVQTLCLEFLNRANEQFEHSTEDDTACQRWLDLLKSAVFSVDKHFLSPLSCKFCELVTLVATVRTCVRAGGHLSSETFTSIMSSLNTVSDYDEFKTEKLKEDLEDLKDMLDFIMEGNPEETLKDFLDELFDVASEAVYYKLWPQSFSFNSIVIKPVASPGPVPQVKCSGNEDVATPTEVLVSSDDSTDIEDGSRVEGQTQKPKTEETETFDDTDISVGSPSTQQLGRRSHTSPLPSRLSWSSDESEDFQPTTKRMPHSAFPFRKRRKKATPWTPTEERHLREGVKAFGVGKWTRILKTYPFDPCRDSVSLKDKWRVMTGSRAKK